MNEIKKILESAKTIAVVGISDDPARPSYSVADYLKTQGYRIFPVNPKLTQVIGEGVYKSLKDIPHKVDIVDIFRRPEAVPEVVDEAIAIGAKVIWMQEGIQDEASAEKARKAGLQVVMDKCMLKEHKQLGIAFQTGDRQ